MYEIVRVYQPKEDLMLLALERLLKEKTTSDSFRGNALVVGSSENLHLSKEGYPWLA